MDHRHVMEKDNPKYCYLVFRQKGYHHGEFYQIYSTKEGAMEAVKRFAIDPRNRSYNPRSVIAYSKSARDIRILEIPLDEYCPETQELETPRS